MKINELFTKLAHLRYPWPVKILVSAVVIYLVNKSLSKDQLWLLFNGISIVPASIAFFLGCMGFYCQVTRWKIILRVWGIDARGVAALRTMLWGCLLAFITPGRAGEFFRGISLPALKKSQTVYATLVDKLFAGTTVLAAGVICCAISLIRNKTPSWGQGVIIIGAVAVMAMAGIVFALRSRSFARKALDSLPVFPVRQAHAVILYSLASHVLLLIQTAVLLSMFGSKGFIDNMLACGQAYSFMLFFPFFIANMGIREYSFRMFLGCGPAGLRNAGLSAIAFGASMGILVINIILPALVGLAWWIIDKKRVSGLEG